MKKINTVLILSSVLVVTACSNNDAKADNHKPSPERIIQFLDKDNDGKISRAEAASARKKKLAENFDFIDKNQDNFIDLSELNAIRRPQ